MITNAHVVQQLVAAHDRELVAAAGRARLRKAATAAAGTSRRSSSWRRRRAAPGSSTPIVLSLTHQPTTQIVR
jgi:hypothetical protein